MKITSKILLFIIFITTQLLGQNKRIMNVDDLWNMKRISSFDISPDNNLIVFAASKYSMEGNKGESDIYMIDASGQNERVLKNSLKSESNPKFSKDGNSIYFERGGQIWKCNLSGENETQVTDFYSGASGYLFSPDESFMIFVSDVYPECTTQKCNEEKDQYYKSVKATGQIFDELMYRHWNRWRGHKRSHLIYFDISKNTYTDLIPNSKSDVPPIDLGSSSDYSISPDGGEIALVMNPDKKLESSTNNEVYLIDLTAVNKGSKPELVKISSSLGNDNQPVYSKDGNFIAFRSMKRAGFEADKYELVIYNRKSAKLKMLTEDWNLSVGDIMWGENSNEIYVTTPYQIYNALVKIKLSSGKRTFILNDINGSSFKLAKDFSSFYLKMQKSTMPYEIFNYNLTSKNLSQITQVNQNLLSSLQMNEIETFWCEGAEGAKVQSIIVKPPFFDNSKTYPMIFLIHGGPQGHWTDDFHYRWNLQMFASKGYVVVAPNPRGSVGYGQKFTDEISLDWGGKVYIDLMNSLDYAIANYKFIDDKNVFAAGASYGGYMINWIEGHNTRFNALVNHDGVFNLESMYGSTEELWFPTWEFGGAPWENREVYQKWSPHMFVQNFKTPMLVVHGGFDFRVPESQAFELFTSLQKMNVDSKFLYFPDETHFVTKPQNSKLWWNTIFDWFNNHMKR